MKRWTTLTIAVLGSLLVLAVFAAVLGPALWSASQTRVSDGVTPALIGETAQVTPPQGWSVAPAPDGAVVVRSPDRRFEVTFTAEPEEGASRRDGSFESALREAHLDAAEARSEVLANGAELRHVTLQFDGAEMVLGELPYPTTTVIFRASVTDRGQLSVYRAELAALLLQVSAAASGTSS